PQCSSTGPNNNNGFGFSCDAGALGALYYRVLAEKAPHSVVPSATAKAGPFTNFQPYLYWSGLSASAKGFGTLSFNSGLQGANTQYNFLFVLPMVPGKLPGTPAPTGNGLQLNPDGITVYDPVANVTWARDANLAATRPFGLPPCTTYNTPAICVAPN